MQTSQSLHGISYTTDFVNKIKQYKIPDNYKLVSFDVKSLFTNIPLKLVISLVTKKWDEIKKHTQLSRRQFLEGLKLIFEYSVFPFDNKVYHQVFGSPMGASLSPVLAELIMEHFEEKCLSKLKFQVPFFFRYVDDIITCAPESEILSMKTIFEKYHPRIKFEVELESEGKLCFLDVMVYNNQDNIITDWYQKPTWTGRFLNFNSHHPLSQKIAIVYNLVDKIKNLADDIFLQKNLELVRTTLQNNLYPPHFIDKYINIRLNTSKKQPEKQIVDTVEQLQICVPYIDQVSQKIQKSCQKYGIKTVFRNQRKNNCNFDKLKVKIVIVFTSDKQSNT